MSRIDYVGRATAIRVGGYDRNTGRLYDKYYPQVEFIEADDETDEDISREFATVGDDYFENELEAIEFAIKYRNKSGYTIG